MLLKEMRPSSSWNSEGSKPLELRMNRIRPLAVDGGAGHQVVVEVAHGRAGRAADAGPAVALHVGVDQSRTRPSAYVRHGAQTRTNRRRQAGSTGSRG